MLSLRSCPGHLQSPPCKNIKLKDCPKFSSPLIFGPDPYGSLYTYSKKRHLSYPVREIHSLQESGIPFTPTRPSLLSGVASHTSAVSPTVSSELFASLLSGRAPGSPLQLLSEFHTSSGTSTTSYHGKPTPAVCIHIRLILHHGPCFRC